MTSPEAQARTILEETAWHRLFSCLQQLVFPAAVLVLVGGCLALVFLGPRGGLPSGGQAPLAVDEAPGLVELPGNTAGNPDFLVVKAGVGERADLFRCIGAITSCVNLTQSPAVTETWPALAATAALTDQVAYYGIGEAATELFVMTLSTTSTLPVTLRAGQSGLHTDFEVLPSHAPAFSPDGVWVAFPARNVKGGAVELFAARSDGQQVLRVTREDRLVRDYIWLDEKSLMIAVQWSDGAIHHLSAWLEAGEFKTQSLD